MPDLVTRRRSTAAGLLIFGLVILGEDPEFLHRELRERVAAADVLAGDAAVEDLVLEADAVDEDVDAARRSRRPRWNVLVGFAVVVRHARRELGEVRKLRSVCGSERICCLADVGRDFAGLGLGQAAAGDDDGARRWRRARAVRARPAVGRGRASRSGRSRPTTRRSTVAPPTVVLMV